MNCKNCGAELKDGAKFCVKCGTQVMNASQAQPTLQFQPDNQTIDRQRISAPSTAPAKATGKLAIILILLIAVFCALGIVLFVLVKNNLNTEEESGRREKSSVTKDIDEDEDDDEDEEDIEEEEAEKETAQAEISGRKPLQISSEEFDKEAKKQIEEYANANNMSIRSESGTLTGGNRIYFATLGPAEPDVAREVWDGNTVMLDSFVEVVCFDPYGEMVNFDRIELIDPDSEYMEDDKDVSSVNYIQFDNESQKESQWVVTVTGMEYEKQYKYGNKDGEIQLLDDEMLFRVKNGRVYLEQRRAWGNYNSSTELVEITCENGEYKQYAAKRADIDELINKYPELEGIIEDLSDYTECIDLIELSEMEGTSIIVTEVNFEYAMTSSDGKIYLTYSFHANDFYMEGVSYDMNVYYTFRDDNGTLKKEEPANFTTKETRVDAPLAVID